jgi:hypothetical protein
MGVLKDHKRTGKLFRPPLTQVGPLSEVRWVVDMLPEFIWIGLLQDRFGLQEGIHLAQSLALRASKAMLQKPKPWFAAMSAFKVLTNDESDSLLSALGQDSSLDKIKEGLGPILEFYPSSPIRFLESTQGEPRYSGLTLAAFKHFLSELFDKRARPATLVQATAVYIGFVTDQLKIMKGVTSFDNFEAIADYPDTEESRQVGASVRATCLSLLPALMEAYSTDWPVCFWNRGLELEPCTTQEDQDA